MSIKIELVGPSWPGFLKAVGETHFAKAQSLG